MVPFNSGGPADFPDNDSVNSFILRMSSGQRSIKGSHQSRGDRAVMRIYIFIR